MRLTAVALLLVVAVALAEETTNWDGEDESSSPENSEYDPDEPSADHTAFAIAFDKVGDKDGATRAFTAAVRHSKNANTLVNLGVWMMRQRKFLGKGEALDAMWQAKTRYSSPESNPLVQDNWASPLRKSPLRAVISSPLFFLSGGLLVRTGGPDADHEGAGRARPGEVRTSHFSHFHSHFSHFLSYFSHVPSHFSLMFSHISLIFDRYRDKTGKLDLKLLPR